MSCEPFQHQVIRASAGSGKTHQLTNRYLGLLAAGGEPDAILATTFTRKAAGEIVDRVLQRLAKAAGDATAAGTLAKEIGQNSFGPAHFTNLLRKLLSSLHRVRIGTLDSFCIALARSFSLELGLPPGWSICEEFDDGIIRQEALEHLLEAEKAEILAALYQRLTHGQTKRGVQLELVDIVNRLYRIHQETDAGVWKKITVPPKLAAAALDELLARIDAFDLTKQARMQKPRTEDAVRARSEQWPELLARGLCGKVFCGENAFCGKPIPEELIGLYTELMAHARSLLLQPVAEQTWATREFLDGFARELGTFKQATGGLRFDEVTQAVVNALRQSTLQAEAIGFRLDGAVEHLLLDEFQDTSLTQWRVLQPIAQAITHAPEQPPRSFFCVGDVKQAIYGWRGGMAEIFGTLPASLGQLLERPLVESRRSAQPVIDVVNKVFGNLDQFDASDKYRAGIATWSERFTAHTTVKNTPGYVLLHTGPAQEDGQGVAEQRGTHCSWVATKVRDLVQQIPQRSIGVLCRKNDTVARMIYELRRLKVPASEEGGNPLTDSPAVELLLSLCKLADHPGHSIAWFHLKNSPLQEHLQAFADPDALAMHLRRELLSDGYGQFAQRWASRVAAVCDRRDLSRLQQLVEMAYAFQARSTLRADDFVAWVRQQRVPDPSTASVRVMTIHGAKGLEFDAVVLPELDSGLTGQIPAFVVGRDPESLDVNLVCRYANEKVQQLLAPDEQRAFEQDRQQRVEESLSLLYVAMTRAVHALYMFIPGPRSRKSKDTWNNMLLQTLAPQTPAAENALLFEHGNANWFQRMPAPAAPPITESQEPAGIKFRTQETARRRGLELVAPSRREGGALVALDRLFHPSEGTGTAAGTLYHAWFETIGWLDDGTPTDAVLRAAAAKKRHDLPAETWGDLDRLLATFRGWLQNPAITCVLRRLAYADPEQPGFPVALAPIWTKRLMAQQVERERRFQVLDGSKFWNGSLDRIVWLVDGERTVAADVIDFKTDDIPPGDEAALTGRVGHYRPQMEAYRQAVASLGRLPAERVAVRLLFTNAGRVVEV